MRYTGFRVGLKRTVNLGNYESAHFELGLEVDLRDEATEDADPDVEGLGLDPSTAEDHARLRELVKEAYADAAKLIVEERLRLLKTPDNVVSIEERIAGATVRPGGT